MGLVAELRVKHINEHTNQYSNERRTVTLTRNPDSTSPSPFEMYDEIH